MSSLCPRWVLRDIKHKIKKKRNWLRHSTNFQGAWDQEMAWEYSQLRTSGPFDCILETTFCYFYLLCIWKISNSELWHSKPCSTWPMPFLSEIITCHMHFMLATLGSLPSLEHFLFSNSPHLQTPLICLWKFIPFFIEFFLSICSSSSIFPGLGPSIITKVKSISNQFCMYMFVTIHEIRSSCKGARRKERICLLLSNTATCK